jgi:hypothetical protein
MKLSVYIFIPGNQPNFPMLLTPGNLKISDKSYLRDGFTKGVRTLVILARSEYKKRCVPISLSNPFFIWKGNILSPLPPAAPCQGQCCFASSQNTAACSYHCSDYAFRQRLHPKTMTKARWAPLSPPPLPNQIWLHPSLEFILQSKLVNT